MKRFIETIYLLIPFLEPYPSWIKVLVGIWVALTAVLIICFLFFRSPKLENVGDKLHKNTSTNLLISSIEPVLEAKVDSKKILTLENKGPTDLKDISIFATRYVFDENSFGKEPKIKEYNKIGGSLYNIPILEAKIGRERFDLAEQKFIKIYERPFGKDNYIPFVTFYCLRVVYREESTGVKYADYIVTTSYKDIPSPIENQEVTASFGTPEGDFMYEIPKIIKAHQKTIFGE